MYLPADFFPSWASYVTGALTLCALVVAGYRLRRRGFNVWGAAGAAALLAALRLLDFPLHNEIFLGGSALGIGFAVVVWGPELASWATAAAIISAGLISLKRDPAALGVNVLIQAVAVVWLVWFLYAPARRRISSEYVAYPLAFGAGAVGALGVTLLSLAAGAAVGLRGYDVLTVATLAGLALGAEEGVLATWGFAFGPARSRADAPAAGAAPPTARAGVWYCAAAVVIATVVAPLVPPFASVGGALGPNLSLARELRAPYEIKVAAGAATVVAAAGIALLAVLTLKIGTRRRRRTPTSSES